MRPARISLLIAIVFSLTTNICADEFPAKEELENSLAYINVYTQSYDHYLPWKKKPVAKSVYYGCAVSENQILTTAEAVINSTFFKVKINSSNEYLSAQVRSIDYSLNLALLELETGKNFKPLTPVKFGNYKEGSQLRCYWLNSRGEVTTGRAYMDHATVSRSTTSHTNNLEYIAADGSQEAGWGEIFYDEQNSVGIAAWFNSDSKESGIVPAESIRNFLKESTQKSYRGFGMTGFKAAKLIDPARRNFLSLPENEKNGVFVTSLRTIGTGASDLEINDVIVSIDGKPINAYGKFEHPLYDEISYEYLITSKPIGEKIALELYRNGKKKKLSITCENFDANEMLIPYYQRGIQPEFIVRGGFVFQQLTRPYLQLWGDNWSGKVPPYLLDIYKRLSFKPDQEKKQIVVLSQVIPDDINIGYQQLVRVVVSKINGKNITSMHDVFDALNGKTVNGFDIIEFELDYPTVVIDRAKAATADTQLAEKYKITQLENRNN